MRNRDYFLPSITTLVLFGLVWFLSCAHQNQYRETTENAFEEFSSFPEAETDYNADFALNSEGADSKNTGDEEDLASSGDQNEFPSEPTPDGSNLDAEKSAFEQVEDSQSEWGSSSENQAFSDQSEFDQEQLSPPIPVPPSSPETPQETATEPDFSSPDLAESVHEDEEAQPDISEARSKVVWVARTPQVPTSSFMKKGTRLNRFYFARKGDSSKKLSQLIYGNASFRKKLIAWNGSRWLPGSMIFYSSPLNAEDDKMVSFYQENQISPLEYRVEKGDSLSAIAKKRLGHTRSWKEIAVVNGIESPNTLEAGQVLALYPRNLSAKESPMVAQAEKLTTPAFTPPPAEQIPVAQEPETIAPIQAQAPVQKPQKEPEPQQPTQAPVAVAPREQTAEPRFQEPKAPVREQVEAEEVAMGSDVNWDQLVEQNFVAILIGAALIILLLALSARKKRKKNTASQEDDSGSEPKSRFGRR